jgi:hypothetical protein
MSVEPFAAVPRPAALTMTLAELVDAEPALTRLLDVRLSAQLAYSVAKLAKAVRTEAQHFTEQRDALIRELGEPVPDDPAGAIRVTPANTAEFLRRVQELAAVEATLTVPPLKLADLPEMTGADLLKLGALVRGAD